MSILGVDHLSSKEILRLLRWRGQAQEHVEALFHLTLCRECREKAHLLDPKKTESLMLRVFGKVDPPALQLDQIDEPDVCRVITGFQERFRVALEQLERSQQSLGELLSHPPAHQRLLVRNSRRFCNEGLAWLLLEEIRYLWKKDPEEAEELSEVTLEMTRNLPRQARKQRRMNDLTALVLAYRANCRRVRSKLLEASRDFQQARILLAKGEGNRVEAAEIDELESSLYRDKRRFEEATSLIHRATEAYRAFGDVQGEARMKIVHGTVLRAAGRQAEACDLLESFLEQFHPEDVDGRMVYWAVHNLATYLTELGEMKRAQDLLPRVRYLAHRYAENFELVRLVWLEAMVLERLGETAQAIECYVEVLDFFAERRIGYDAALVALDLAAVYLDSGRCRDAQELAAQLVPLFEVHEVHREAAAALALFFEAVEKDQATAALARDVAKFLKTTRGHSGESYEPAAGLLTT